MSGAIPGKPDDVAYLRRVIPAVVQAACADADRVGVTGVSNGGGHERADGLRRGRPDRRRRARRRRLRLAARLPSVAAACRSSRSTGCDDDVVPYRGKGPTGAGAVAAFLAQWRAARRAAAARAQRARAATHVAELRWTGCAGGTMVVHDRITDAEHGWPGESDLGQDQAFSSTQRTWRFLSAFRR